MGRIAPDIVPVKVGSSDSSWTPLHLFDFSGGMITDFPDSAIADNQFKDIFNYYIDENNSLVTRPPFQPYYAASGEAVLPTVPEEFIWVNLNNADYLITHQTNGTIARWSSGTWTSIITGQVSSSYRADFAKFSSNNRDDLIIFNGPGGATDVPMRWDTTQLATDLGLGAPLDDTYTITEITKANPAVITVSEDASALIVGREVQVSDADGDASFNAVYNIISVSGSGPTSVTTDTNTNSYAAPATTGILHDNGVVQQTGGSGTAPANERGIQFNGSYAYTFTYFYESTTSTKHGESGSNIEHLVEITGCVESSQKRATVTIHEFSTVPSGVARINVYRSPADAPDGPFRLVGTIIDLDTDWIDNTPVGEEGVEVPSDAGTPPRLKYIVVANGRLWGVGLNSSGALGNKIVWSENGSVDMFFAANAFYATEDITGLAYFNRNMYAFTKDAMWFLLDSDPVTNDWLKIAEKGCTSHHSIVDIGRGLVFQGRDNIYFFDHNTQNRDGDFPIPIADGLSKRILDINTNRKANSAAAMHDNRYHLSYTASGSVNNATIVWQTQTLPIVLQGKTAGWSQYSWSANHMQSFNEFLYTADATNKYIQEHGVFGVYDQWTKAEFDAQRNRPISTTLTTKRFHFDHPWTDKHFSSITAVGESSGVTMPVTLSLNNNEFLKGTSLVLGTFIEPIATSAFGVGTFWTLPVDVPTGGDAYFATDNFTFRSAYARFETGAVGKNAQLTVNAENSADTKLIGLTLHHKEAPLPM